MIIFIVVIIVCLLVCFEEENSSRLCGSQDHSWGRASLTSPRNHSMSSPWRQLLGSPWYLAIAPTPGWTSWTEANKEVMVTRDWQPENTFRGNPSGENLKLSHYPILGDLGRYYIDIYSEELTGVSQDTLAGGITKFIILGGISQSPLL